MITLGKIKQDYKEITDLMANYTFSLESIRELNGHLHQIGHNTLIEINGKPIDEIESIKDSEIKWLRLDDYKNLSYIYFDEGWNNTANKVMFDAYLATETNGDGLFLEDLHITELDNAYLNELNNIVKTNPDLITDNVIDDLAVSDNPSCRAFAAMKLTAAYAYENRDYRKRVSEYISGKKSADILTICKTVKSQVKHTTIRQKVYKKSSPQNVQVNE